MLQPDLDLRTLTTETGFFTESGGGNEVYSENNCSDFGGSPVSGPMSVSPTDIKSGLKPSD